MQDHVLATFARRQEAFTARERARQAFPDNDVRIGDVDDQLDAMSLGQRQQMDESVATMSVGIMSGPMVRGAVIWGAVGLVVGALVSLPVAALIDPGGFTPWQLALFFALAGALGLSSATFVLGAAARSVKEGETTPEDPTAVVRIDVRPDEADAVIRVLVEAGARSARFVDAPVVRPPTGTVEAPRPIERDGVGFKDRGYYDAGFSSDAE